MAATPLIFISQLNYLWLILLEEIDNGITHTYPSSGVTQMWEIVLFPGFFNGSNYKLP